MKKIKSIEDVLENENRKKIMDLFVNRGLSSIIQYQEIKSTFQDFSRPDNDLKELVVNGLLRRIRERGNYQISPSAVSEIRRFFKLESRLALVGSLDRNVGKYIELIQSLEDNEIMINASYLLCSSDIKKEFKNTFKDLKIPVFLEAVVHKAILREEAEIIREKFEEIIQKVIYDLDIIVDLTLGTKLVMIQLIDLARKYKLRSFMITRNKINWF